MFARFGLLTVLIVLALSARPSVHAQEGPDSRTPAPAEDTGASVADPEYQKDQPVTIELVGYEPGDLELVGSAWIIGPVETDIAAGEPLDPCDFAIEITEKSTTELAATGKITAPVTVPALCPNVRLSFTARAKEPVRDASGKLTAKLTDTLAEGAYQLLLNGDLTVRERGANVYMSEKIQKYPLGLDAPAAPVSSGGGRSTVASTVIPTAALAIIVIGGGAYVLRRRRM